jgi:hypothetical protein
MTTTDALYAVDDLLTLWIAGESDADETFMQILMVLESTELCN